MPGDRDVPPGRGDERRDESRDELEALLDGGLAGWERFDLSDLPERDEPDEPDEPEGPAAAPAFAADAPERAAPGVDPDPPEGAADAPSAPPAEALGPDPAPSPDGPPGPGEPDGPSDADGASEAERDLPLAPDLAWKVARVLLGVVTLVAAVVVVVAAGPSVAGGIGDAVGTVGDAASGGASGLADAWERWSGRLEDIAAQAVEPGEVTVEAPEGSASVLIVVVGDDERGRSYALVARGPDGASTVMLAPPGLRGILPGYGDFPLADAPLFEDAELVALALANQLGIRIDGVLTLGPGDLSGALGTPIDLDLPVPLIVGEGDEGQVLAKSGRAERSPAVMETVITTQGISDELEWLQRQGAAWEAIVATAATDPDLADRLAAFAAAQDLDVAALLRAVGADDDRNVTAVPVTRVAVGGPDAGFALNSEAAEPFVAQRLGHLLLRQGPRPRVEVLNGNGRVGTTRVVAQQLVRRGFRVVRTDNADAFDYEDTQVVAHGRSNRTEAEGVLDLIGTGELLLELRNPSGVVDISIIVGRDVPAGEG